VGDRAQYSTGQNRANIAKSQKSFAEAVGTLIYTARIQVQLSGFRRSTPWRASPDSYPTLLQRREKEIMAKIVCKLLGIVLLIVGLLGFTHILDALGAHVGPAYATHNLVHIVSGILALYFGFAGSFSSAKGFCLVFGIVYTALGILGFALGHPPDHMWIVGPLTP